MPNHKRGGFRRNRGGRNFNKSGPKREYRHLKQLTEQEVGISEYLSPLEGYSAVIKARFSDFQVNEINLEGKMAKLTDTTIPKSFALQLALQPKILYEELNESPLEKIPQETWDALKTLVKSTEGTPVLLDAENLSKEDRKSIHTCVKSYFGKEIVASTIKKDEKSVMEFRKYEKGETDKRTYWPDGVPEFVHFIAYKELMDTMDACFKIGKVLNMPANKISYAGVKDRRAKTSQWFCIKRIEPAKLMNKTKYIKNLRIGNIEFKEECLKIGKLRGNRFRIALRNVQAEEELITKSIEHIKDHGFINYYGLQRFGNDKEAPTFLIGIKLLLGQWKEAIDLILKVKSGDDPTYPINKAKKLYAETQDAAKALELCDDWVSLERKLLEGLAKHHDRNLVNSLDSIPRSMRLMYIHAFQSYIWNKMVSKRIQEFGLKPVEGDFVFVENAQVEEPVIDDTEDSEDDETDENGDTDDQKVKEEPKETPVRPLQSHELDKFTIHDIVLPLPGYDIVYPENMKNFYKEAIEECGLTLEMPKQRVRMYNLSGTYRKICQKVEDVDWKILFYNDPTDNLIRSDLEELQKKEEPKSVENGKFKAVVVSFTLNSSSYATMVLRELLKSDTSSSYQATFNNYADPDKTIGTVEGPKNDESADINEVKPGSLLADTEKYEDFKSQLFKNILLGVKEEGGSEKDETNKRECENEGNEKSFKKLKVGEDQN